MDGGEFGHTGETSLLTRSNTIRTNMPANSSSSSPYHCSDSTAAVIMFFVFIATKMLLFIPLSILVFYLGHQRWRRQRSFATTSHSDIFTLHVAAMDLIHASGCAVFICGLYAGLSWMRIVGFYTFAVALPGQMGFHILTCVERYLAVVHPVIYLGLRHSGGDKIRNISIACVWLLSFGWSGLTILYIPNLPTIPFFCILVLSLVVVLFCCVSVLTVLIRPGPGEVGGDRERVDRLKQRAFHTIMAIMGVLWLWFAGFLVCLALDNLQLLSYSDGCLVLVSGNWFSLPSSLVLPLLFLYRARKLPCCHPSSE